MPCAEERRAFLADGFRRFGFRRGSWGGNGIALDSRQQRIHVGQKRGICDAGVPIVSHAAVFVQESILVDVFNILAEIYRFQTGAAVKDIHAQIAHAVYENNLAQVGAVLERAVLKEFDGRIADYRFQRFAVFKGIVGDFRIGFRNYQGARRQFYLVVVAIGSASHHAAANHGQLHAVDFPGQDQIELVALIRVQTGIFLVEPEIVAGQGRIGHCRERVLFAYAGNRVIPRTADEGAQRLNLFSCGIGRGIDFCERGAVRQQSFRQDGRIA